MSDTNKQGATSTSGAWFIQEVEPSGRTALVPANWKVTLVALVVLLCTISSAIGGMSLMIAAAYAQGALCLLLAAALIALIAFGLLKKTAKAGP